MKVKIIVKSNFPRKKKKKHKKSLEDLFKKISVAELIWCAGEMEMIEVQINSEGGDINLVE